MIKHCFLFFYFFELTAKLVLTFIMSDLPTKLLEEKLRRARRAKLRFRAAVRDVIYNLSWLQDDITSSDDTSDVTAISIKQAVTRIVKKRTPTDVVEGKVTIEEKALLRKDVKYRTEEDKNILNKCIGGLKCFRSYPPAVQSELVGVTYFEYYGSGRTLIRQNDEGHAIYFLLSGEVVIYKKIYDELSNQYEEIEVNRLKKGQMFGEIALLHNIPRTATCITAAPCELLVMKKNDFNRILKTNLMEIWDQVKAAMAKFVYFEDWNKIMITECCILSRLESFGPNEIIFGDKVPPKGMPTYTYFIIEGICSVVEHLYVQEIKKDGLKYYKLFDISTISSTLEEQSVNTKCSKIDFDALDKAVEKIANKSYHTRVGSTKSGMMAMSSTDLPSRVADALKSSLTSFHSSNSIDIEQKKKETAKEKRKLPPNVKVIFMQICTLAEKATFIDNDLMKNRRVIALTPCKVLCIPTYYLIQHNKGNVWTRVEYYIRTKLPSTKDVFERYVSCQKWKEYKKKVVNEVLSKKRYYNSTTIHDVPYTIRAKCDQ